MSTLSSVPRLSGRSLVLWPLFAACGVLIIAVILVPDLHRPKVVPSTPKAETKTTAKFAAPTQLEMGATTGRMALAAEPPAQATGSSATFDRKIVRTGSLQALVKSPVDAAEKLRTVTERLGGYIESLQINADQGAPTANLTLRVPANRLEDAKAEFRKLAIRIENEQSNASDVTKQYVDGEAKIKNLRAEEAQYLTIMRRAMKVDDMLQVSDKIAEVRGEIEQQQAEFATLSKQVETVALTIYLRAEPAAPAASGWHPVYELQLAAKDALEGLTSYATTMMAVILEIPVVLLWLATIVLGGTAGWKLIRWLARLFFSYPKQQAA